MPASIIFILYGTGNPSYSNQVRREIKGIKIGIKEVKKGEKKKAQQLFTARQESEELQDIKSSKKSLTFLLITNEQSEKEIFLSPLITASIITKSQD